MVNINNKNYPEVIKFIRQKDFLFKSKLGEGACGETILIEDEIIGESFVCKKYAPCSELYRDDFFNRFCKEIKILYKLNHNNIVRIFNYYLYPSTKSGYILMEYINGMNISEYLTKYPEKINSIFEQAIEAFAYLEGNKVLHRDVRASNIMVTFDGCLKLIDFGFSKNLEKIEKFSKSISLNWWCETPDEFEDSIYDFKTDIYFLGKLFEKIIKDKQISIFAYKDCLRKMIKKNPQERMKSFSAIQCLLKDNLFERLKFTEKERDTYITFARSLSSSIVRLPYSITYEKDIEKIIRNLEDVYRKNMLEYFVLNNNSIIECFCSGNFTYKTKKEIFNVQELNEFIDLLKSCSLDKLNIILSNLHSRLDSIEHYMDEDNDDDIPF